MYGHFLLEKFVHVYESLSEPERCIYDHYFGDKFDSYTYSDIAKICWPDRDKPVADSYVSQRISEIRKKFEQEFFESEEDEDKKGPDANEDKEKKNN